jgi:hypothetical protein
MYLARIKISLMRQEDFHQSYVKKSEKFQVDELDDEDFSP